MKFIKPLLFLSLLCTVLFGAVHFLSPLPPVVECENVFSSGIYAGYRAKLKKFLAGHPDYHKVLESPATPFNNKMRELIGSVEHSSGRTSRKQHREFVLQLREGIRLAGEGAARAGEESSHELLRDLSKWVYLDSELNEEIQNYFFEYTSLPGEEDEILSYIDERSYRLHEDDRLDGLSSKNKQEDLYLHGNLPSVYFDLENAVRTKVIRAGSPSIKNARIRFLPPRLSPEFLYFVKHQPGHLYVNLMKRRNDEGRISKKLERLDRDLPNFSTISLDKNSTFYTQSGKYRNLDNGSKFKRKFIQHLHSKHYYWSEKLDAEAWSKELADIVDHVHNDYFGNKARLVQKDRADFIELAYLEILDRVVEKLQPPSMNISCHHGMDRGPSLLVLWMFKHKEVSNRELAALLLAPPMAIHNRSSHLHRIKRFISASRRLSKAYENDL